LRAYTTIYDRTKNRIGFSKNIDEVFEQMKADERLVLIIAVVCLFILGVLVVAGIIIYFIVNKKKKAAQEALTN
jgi:Na+/melibiose symporter-like transporter